MLPSPHLSAVIWRIQAASPADMAALWRPLEATSYPPAQLTGVPAGHPGVQGLSFPVTTFMMLIPMNE